MSVCDTCHRERLEASREKRLGEASVHLRGVRAAHHRFSRTCFVSEVGVVRRRLCFAALAFAHALFLMLPGGCARASPIGHVLLSMFMHVALCESVN